MKKSENDILILGIESSCDETAASVIRNGREVLSNIISSQIDIHTLYGGVVPEGVCPYEAEPQRRSPCCC